MGYMGNQLATVSTGAFAAVLTGLWFYFLDFAPVLNFIFTMAVPIIWFLTLMCWLAQKSADYGPKECRLCAQPSIAHDAGQSAIGAPIISITTSGDQEPPKAERQVGAISYAETASDRDP